MRRLLPIVFFALLGLGLMAQNEPSPISQSDSVDTSIQTEPVELLEDTIASDPVRILIPSIYIDYGKLLAIPLATETKYEGGIEFLMKEKIPLIFEVGMATLNPTKVYSNGTYEAQGLYYRFGTGIYSQWQSKNKLGLTFKYGVSSFDETAVLETENTINIPRTLSDSYKRTNVNASWMEFGVYTDRSINRFLALGMNLRFRYLLDYDRQTPDDVYAIPGYGRSFDQSIPAVNLFLKVSF